MKRGGKITVICPHCGQEQQEPDLVKSTYCRKCSGYFTVARDRAPTSGPAKTPLKQAPAQKPKGGLMDLLSGFGGLVGGQRTRVIRCFECKHEQEVSTSAKSSICPACSAYIDLEEVKIHAPFSRALRTRGNVLIGPKGEYASTRGFCTNAIIQGKLKGSLVCDGEALVKTKGRLTGVLEARTVIIEKHSDVEFTKLMKAQNVEIRGKAIARIEATGAVHIAKGGSLEGSIVARGFTVEKGGIFNGDVTIGRVDVTQAELTLDPTGGAPAAPPAEPDLFGRLGEAAG